MNKLVTSSCIQQPSSPVIEVEDTSRYRTPEEIPDTSDPERPREPGGIYELPTPLTELPGSDLDPVSLRDLPPSQGLQITAEENAAVNEIFAEAEQKFIHQGRYAPSRANTVKKPSPLDISRKPLPTLDKTLRATLGSPPSTVRVPRPADPEWEGVLGANSKPSRPPPVPAKIPLDSLPERHLRSGTLSSSINYVPSLAIEKVFMRNKKRYSERGIWPSDFKLWLRIAEWWFLKVEITPIPLAKIYRVSSIADR